MKNELIMETPEMAQIEKSKAEKIRDTFAPMVKKIAEFEDSYNTITAEAEKEITAELSAKAKRVRLDISKIRIEVEKVRKFEKEEYLRAGKAIDGVANIFKWAIADKEEKLEKIEKHAEILEQKRLADLQILREEQLSLYCLDANQRNLSSMDEDVWNAFLSMKKKEHFDLIEAKEKAEQQRLAEEARQKAEQIRLEEENKKIKEAQKVVDEQKRKLDEEQKRARLEAENKAKLEAEEKKRANDKEHIKTVNRSILSAFMVLGCDEEIAKEIIKCIVKNEIKNISIKY